MDRVVIIIVNLFLNDLDGGPWFLVRVFDAVSFTVHLPIWKRGLLRNDDGCNLSMVRILSGTDGKIAQNPWSCVLPKFYIYKIEHFRTLIIGRKFIKMWFCRLESIQGSPIYQTEAFRKFHHCPLEGSINVLVTVIMEIGPPCLGHQIVFKQILRSLQGRGLRRTNERQRFALYLERDLDYIMI